MRRSDYSELAAPGEPLLDTYIAYFGAHEYDNRHLINHDPTRRSEQASLLIGRGCLRLSTDSFKETAAKRSFLQAQRLLAPVVDRSKEIHRSIDAARILLLDSIISILLARQQPDTLTALRMDMHDRLMIQLSAIHRDAINANKGRGRAKLTGATNELTALGMLTRNSHPWWMGLLALQHHDQSQDSPNNFDILFVHTNAADVAASSYPIQVKSGCIGMCDNPDPNSRAITALDHYTSNIILISGCCDLGYFYNDKGDHFPTTQKLIGEWRGRATDDSIEILNATTDRLIDTVVNDPTRRGHLPVLA
jgi:hypothetical protein